MFWLQAKARVPLLFRDPPASQPAAQQYNSDKPTKTHSHSPHQEVNAREISSWRSVSVPLPLRQVQQRHHG
jgi:hypothetical protein